MAHGHSAAAFVYTPSDFLGWALRSGWQPAQLPVGVVYTFQAPVARRVAEQTDRFVENTDLTVSNARMYMTDDGGPPVLLACLNPGAAAMVTQLEHLRLLAGEAPLAAVIVGTAGAIAGPHLIADTVVVGSALRTDHISDSYLPPAPVVDADPGLTDALTRRLGERPVTRSWTVTVPYRSTHDDLVAARAGGAEVVEMEAASLFAAGAALDIATAAAVVISDVTRHDEPVDVDWSDTLEPTMVAVDAAIEAIRGEVSAPA